MSLREEMPDIPKIHNPELRDAVKTLVTASDTLRGLLVMALSEEDSKIKIMTEHRELMLGLDKVVERWLLEFE